MSDGPRTPTHCPHCGHGGALDSHGSFLQSYQRTRAGVKTAVEERWEVFHCPDCDERFAMLDNVEEETGEASAILPGGDY